MLRIGIDEAGLGPLLGPLVVAGASFRLGGERVPAAPFETDLRARLRHALSAPGDAGPGAGADGLIVGDSKQVWGPGHDLARLEVPVLAFAACAGDGTPRVPASLDELLTAVGADPGERARVAWYAGDAPHLPLRAERDQVVRAAASLRAALDAAGVSFEGFQADVVPEPRLNDAFARTPNKADVLFAHAADVLDRLLAARRPGEPAGVAFDRQGGRRYYLPPLHAWWPQRFAWAVEETAAESRYRVGFGDAEGEYRFVVGGDAVHLETGLASMCAKYLREAFMGLWNGYFGRVCPGVRGTAGYAQDAQRWLAATCDLRATAGVPDRDLVRTR